MDKDKEVSTETTTKETEPVLPVKETTTTTKEVDKPKVDKPQAE